MDSQEVNEIAEFLDSHLGVKYETAFKTVSSILLTILTGISGFVLMNLINLREDIKVHQASYSHAGALEMIRENRELMRETVQMVQENRTLIREMQERMRK